MIFGKLLNSNQQGSGSLKSGGAGACSGDACHGSSAGERLEITNVWSGPIIILSSESQIELEKHYLNYSSTIPAESFEAIFRGSSVDDF